MYESDLLNPNFVEKISMSKVNFWFFSFIETKSLNIDSFTKKKKKFAVNKVL